MKRSVKIVLIVVALIASIPVLAVLGGIAYFGAVNPDNLVSDRCSVSPEFACTEFRADASSNHVTLTLINNQDASMQDISMTFSHMPGDACTPVTSFADLTVPSGAPLTAEFDCGSLTRGERFRGEFELTYLREGTAFPRTTVGDIFTQVR